MADTDLLNYYYGINERIRDIDRGMRRDERPHITKHQGYIHQTPFLIGGEGYHLIQQRKMIFEELRKRKILP